MTGRIRVMTITGDSIETGGEELLDRRPAAGKGWTWIDLQGVDAALEREILTQRFGISRLAVQDAQRERHPPKFERFDDYVFMLLRELGVSSDTDEPVFVHTSLFLGRDFVVSRRDNDSPSLDLVWGEIASGTDDAALEAPHLAYLICRAMVDQYTPVVLAMEERLGDLEDEMFENPSDAILESLSGYNRTLKRLRRTFSYQHGIMKTITSPIEPLPFAFDVHEFTDIGENMERLASLSQLNQELAVDLMNAYLSVASHRLNQIMRVLTIATVIFLPLGLLAGIYGMNFESMPELKFRYGYFVVLGVMLTVVLSLVTIFRRRNWL